jgi:hypothetical protein
MTTDSAIREDVPAGEKQGEEGFVPTEQQVKDHPRMKLMELMGNRRTDDVEFEAAGEVTPQHAKPIGIPGGEEDGATQVERQVQQPTDATVRVKVNGRETNVPLADVIAGYQKNTAADERLQEASRLLREATERAEQLAAQMATTGAAAPRPAAGAAEDSRQQPGGDDLRTAAKQVLSSLYEGDEEKAADTLADLIASGRNQLSTEQIAKQVAPLVMPEMQQEAARNSALTTLQTDYPVLFTDPDYASIANAHVGRLMAEGRTQAEAILGAGEYVVQKFQIKKTGRPNGAGSTAVNVDSASRLERKQAIDPVPGLGVSSASSNQQESSSPSSVIAEMRKARGQAA